MINLIFILLTSISQAKTIKVAVIDTGLNFKNTKVKICDSGHADFSGEGFKDILGHGTNVSNIINDIAKNTNYCQIIIKYYTSKNTSIENGDQFFETLRYTIALKPDIIHLSVAGNYYNSKEIKLLKEALNEGIKIVAAIGNDGKDLNKKCNVYPACSDKRIIKVGNLIKKGMRNNTSNYTRDTVWEIGTDVEGGGITMTGTSQAAARHTGKLIKEIANGTNR